MDRKELDTEDSSVEDSSVAVGVGVVAVEGVGTAAEHKEAGIHLEPSSSDSTEKCCVQTVLPELGVEFEKKEEGRCPDQIQQESFPAESVGSVSSRSSF